MKALYADVEKRGIPVAYSTPAVGLVREGERVTAVVARHAGQTIEIECGAVILASGGFESNAELRARYLGPGWDMAKVRGTRFNMGKGLLMALDVGARAYGKLVRLPLRRVGHQRSPPSAT